MKKVCGYCILSTLLCFISICVDVQEILDGLEFARSALDSKWGSTRAAIGHPEPFDLRYVAIGKEDCDKTQYHGMQTLLFLADHIFMIYIKNSMPYNFVAGTSLYSRACFVAFKEF